MMIIIAVTDSIFNLGPQYFAWKQMQIIPTDDDIDDNYDNDENDNIPKLDIFKTRSYKLFMVVDRDNAYS